ncbi:septum formation inhibitor Maf [Kordia sp. YSTF-M3]|uniref:Septum formation inhibitor Maf n=1 Tax=Kordia aestuariivivens TaxID=2759037 RepID=A0ABR7Q641_9FLAO|nr:septum formation inhibitor Maf [Kordia aestuariivivens]MBC8754029.1 septum formation inhibitor Maf [Kordia aestuariivivens]
MKSISRHLILAGLTIIGTIIACSNIKNDTATTLTITTVSKLAQPTSEAFNKYWYAGTAEITSYELEQARYGEIHKGKSVLIYVTEDFNPTKQVKADQQRPNNIPILKLNSTKKFYTGIYPYSTMTSTFYPVANNKHAIKVTASMQEWCGHIFTQLNTREQFEVQSYSYFESESDQEFTTEKAILEDELWTKLRIDPTQLPTGAQQIIPAFEVLRMKHIPLKAYEAIATLTANGTISTYTLNYPKLNRKLAINFNTSFPYDILGWTERTTSGYGSNAKLLTTKATRIKQLKSPYWSKNGVKDSILRKELRL